jgi:hypothetical protein
VFLLHIIPPTESEKGLKKVCEKYSALPQGNKKVLLRQVGKTRLPEGKAGRQ